MLSVYFRNTVNHSRYLKPGGTCLRYDGLIKACYKIPNGTMRVTLFVVAVEGMLALSTVSKRISFTVIFIRISSFCVQLINTQLLIDGGL